MSWAHVRISVGAICFALLFSIPASATTYRITGNGDSGPGSLRWAIEQANADPSPPTVIGLFATDATMTFYPQTCFPVITRPVEIDFTGYQNSIVITIDGTAVANDPNCALLSFNAPGQSQIKYVRLQNAYQGIRFIGVDGSSALSVIRSTIENNNASINYGYGGGIRSVNAQLFLDSVQLYNNRAYLGGGLSLEGGSLYMDRSAVRSNWATGWGGGMYLAPAWSMATVSRTSITSNGTDFAGGGIALSPQSLSGGALVRNSTLAENSAIYGAGVYFYDSFYTYPTQWPRLSLQNATIAQNHTTSGGAGNVMTVDIGAVHSNASAFGSGSGNAELCSMAANSARTGNGNVAEHISCNFSGTGNKTVTSLGLGQLEFASGGDRNNIENQPYPTYVARPRPGSEVLDVGRDCHWDDQLTNYKFSTQGTRTANACDAGAVESNSYGAQRTAVILVYNDDSPIQHLTERKQWLEAIALPLMDKQLRESSYNRSWLETTVLGPYYVAADGCGEPYSPQNRQYMFRQGVNAADASIDFSSINRIMILNTSKNPWNCLLQSESDIGMQRQELLWPGFTTNDGRVVASALFYTLPDPFFTTDPAWIPPDPIPHTMIHESQHSLGFEHVFKYLCRDSSGQRVMYGTTCEWITSQDVAWSTPWRFMSHADAWTQAQLGWLDTSNVKTVSPTGISRQYIIAALENPGPTAKMLKLPLSDGNFIFLEYRRPILSDADQYRDYQGRIAVGQAISLNGVFAYVYNPTFRRTYALDPPPYPTDTSFGNSPLPVGMTISASNLRIRVDNTLSSSAAVTVWRQ